MAMFLNQVNTDQFRDKSVVNVSKLMTQCKRSEMDVHLSKAEGNFAPLRRLRHETIAAAVTIDISNKLRAMTD